MPNQTTLATHSPYMRVADGCACYIQGPDDVAYTDLGVTKGGSKIIFKGKKFQEQTGNAGKTALYIKEQEVTFEIILKSVNMATVTKSLSGLITSVATPASENSSIPNQTIAAGWADNTRYELIALTSSSDSTKLKLPTKPTLTAVTIATDTTPETLTEWSASASGDYTVVRDAGFVSGWAIIFNSASMAVSDPTTRVITIDWGANTPTARTTYYTGTTIAELEAFKMKFEHTDSASKVQGRELYKCYINPDSIDFSFKGQDEEGFNEMTFSGSGTIDTTLTDGRQLMSIYEDTGAV